jgi:hypothetical protein
VPPKFKKWNVKLAHYGAFHSHGITALSFAANPQPAKAAG